VLLPNPTGEDESYGVAFNLMDGKFVLRLISYKNEQLNARNGDANTVAQRVIRTDLPLIGATPGRFMLYNVAGATTSTAANFNRWGWIKIQNPTWSDAQVLTELSSQMNMSQSVMNALRSKAADRRDQRRRGQGHGSRDQLQSDELLDGLRQCHGNAHV
jgi:hypothetical protein